MRFRDRLLRAKVRVLRLQPGDVVVLETLEVASAEQCGRMRDHWERRLPDVPCVVLGGATVGAVLRREERP